MKLIVQATLLTGALLFSPSSDVSAQAYRCGNVYQDHPCAGGQSAKPVMGSSSRSATSSGARGVIAGDGVCAQRGGEAIKIVWARESGVTQEKAIANASDAAQRKLIADVYRVRGGALDVKERIEAECKAELEERAKLLALHEAMVKAGVTATSGQTNPSSPADAALAEKRVIGERLAPDQRAEAGRRLRGNGNLTGRAKQTRAGVARRRMLRTTWWGAHER